MGNKSNSISLLPRDSMFGFGCYALRICHSRDLKDLSSAFRPWLFRGKNIYAKWLLTLVWHLAIWLLPTFDFLWEVPSPVFPPPFVRWGESLSSSAFTPGILISLDSLVHSLVFDFVTRDSLSSCISLPTNLIVWSKLRAWTELTGLRIGRQSCG